jgi:hypothetical protein
LTKGNAGNADSVPFHRYLTSRCPRAIAAPNSAAPPPPAAVTAFARCELRNGHRGRPCARLLGRLPEPPSRRPRPPSSQRPWRLDGPFLLHARCFCSAGCAAGVTRLAGHQSGGLPFQDGRVIRSWPRPKLLQRGLPGLRSRAQEGVIFGASFIRRKGVCDYRVEGSVVRSILCRSRAPTIPRRSNFCVRCWTTRGTPCHPNTNAKSASRTWRDMS